MKTTATWAVIIVLVILGAWYWQSTKGSPVSTEPGTQAGVQGSENQTNTGQAAVAPVVTLISDAKLGAILVASNGMTLYTYAKDTAGVSNCSGTCAVNWPPYAPSVDEPLVAGTGITGQLATIARADGSTQFTYKGMPLYFWKNDAKPGDTSGQNVGGMWFVVNP